MDQKPKISAREILEFSGKSIRILLSKIQNNLKLDVSKETIRRILNEFLNVMYEKFQRK